MNLLGSQSTAFGAILASTGAAHGSLASTCAAHDKLLRPPSLWFSRQYGRRPCGKKTKLRRKRANSERMCKRRRRLTRRHARSCQVRAPPMKFLLGMQVPPTISEKTASPFIACGRTMKKRRTQAGADTCKGNNKSKQDQQHDHNDDHEHDRDDYHDDNAMIIITC